MILSHSRLNQRLCRFCNCHQGQRLILICNGPSLNETDFSLLRGEVIMGLNKIYLGFSKFRFYPRYYVAINKRVIEQSAASIKRLNCIRFIKDMGEANPFPESALTYFMPSRPEQKFHKDLSMGFFEGYTVTFAALQIAFYMGFAQVVIVGMDHRYSYQGSPNEPRKLNGQDPNHFDPSYFRGQTWDNPDLTNSEKYYKIARSIFEKEGRQIFDCTVDGACDVFHKASLEELLN